jgi:hypothetical protein
MEGGIVLNRVTIVFSTGIASFARVGLALGFLTTQHAKHLRDLASVSCAILSGLGLRRTISEYSKVAILPLCSDLLGCN